MIPFLEFFQREHSGPLMKSLRQLTAGAEVINATVS